MINNNEDDLMNRKDFLSTFSAMLDDIKDSYTWLKSIFEYVYDCRLNNKNILQDKDFNDLVQCKTSLYDIYENLNRIESNIKKDTN